MPSHRKADPGQGSPGTQLQETAAGRRASSREHAHRRALRIAAIYALCGLIWITTSDRVLASFITDSAVLTQLQTYKGWFFIVFTAMLVFFLTRQALQEPERLAWRIRSGETRYRALFESIDAAVLLMRGSECTECNPATLKLFGLDSKDEIIGKTPLDFAPKRQPGGRESAEMVRSNIEKALQTGLHVFEWQAIRKNGEQVFMEVRFTPYRIGDEQYFQCIAIDISERKKAQVALEMSEAKFRRLYNETPVMLHSIDRNAVLLDVNDHWLRTMGYARTEVIGRKVTDFYTEASRNYARDIGHPAFFRDGVAQEVPYQFVKKSGEVIDVLLSATAERDAAGNVVRSQAVIEDVTARKRAEAEVREQEKRYRMLFESANDGIFIHDETGFIDCNRRGAEMYGLSREQVIGRSPAEFAPPLQPDGRPSAQVAGERIRPAMEGVPQTFEWQALRSDGGTIDVEVNLSRLELNGKACLQAIVRDIGERKQAEREIAERGARLRQIIDTADASIFLLDLTGRISLVNRRMAEMFCCTMNELLGSEYLDFIPAAEKERRRPQVAAMLTGEMPSIDAERRFLRKDGTEFWGHLVGKQLLDAAGTRLGLIGVLTDITRRKETEAALQRSQKLESIATLAGGIAHDFNNLLQGVFGYVSMARLSIDRRDRALAMLGQAEKALQSSVNLSNQLLTFSKGGKPVKEVIDLRLVIENAVRFALSGSSVEHVLALDGDLQAVEADPGQITQVIQNIVLNAEQAMPLGGRIEITACNRQSSTLPGLNLPSTAGLVEISVKDSGTGIPEEYLSRIFDPYFTTKEKGSGLGLATSHSIIANHGGTIAVKSKPGEGSMFSIYLPATEKPAPASHAGDQLPAGRRGRILLMDDEAVVRMVATELLQELGHEVTCVENGEAVLARYGEAKAAGAPFDAVILDLTVRGGMGGAEALKLLLALDPQVRTVVSSGYSDDTVIGNYRELGFRAFLKKPYDIQQLEKILDQLLS